jgi:hypothetical protein
MIAHTTKRACQIVVFITIALASPVLFAQRGSSTPEEFRADYTKLFDSLSARVPESDQSAWAIDIRQRIGNLRTQFNELPYPTLAQLSKAYDHAALQGAIDKLGAENRSRLPQLKSSARMGTKLAIQPPDYSAAVDGTTCSTSQTSASTMDGEKIGLYVDRGLSVVADYACETIVEILGEGTNAPACAAAAITKGVEVVLDSLIDHQEFCNGLLDGALAESTHADVSDIHGDVDALDTHLTNVNNQITTEFTGLDTHLTNVNNQITAEFAALDNHVTNVDNHIAAEFATLDAHMVTLFAQLSTQLTNSTNLLGADLKQVMKLELTPEGQRQIVPAILTCNGTNCPNVLDACPAAGCSWNRVGPLP